MVTISFRLSKNVLVAMTVLLMATKSSTAFVTSSPTTLDVVMDRSMTPLYASTDSSASTSFDADYYMPDVSNQGSSSTSSGTTARRITLARFLSQTVKEHPELKPLKNIYLAVQMACKTISRLVNRAGLVLDTMSPMNEDENYSDGRFYSMKRLDKLSTTVMKNALKFTGTVKMCIPEVKMDSEIPEQHQPGVLVAYDQNYLACLDPMDGSGNADASICTGTIFGVFDRSTVSEDTMLEKAILQPAKNMVAAGYCIYSSATVLVLTLGEGVYGFTLDPQINEFVLTHEHLTIPQRGTVYSCNEANSEGWTNDSWKEYLRNIKLGKGESQTRYAHRYVGSMVGDIHRTLLYGGIFAYPSSTHKPTGNLQLLYKTAPMSFVVDQAGGIAMDEDGNNLLDKKPERIHQKSPCFMGSPQDMQELQKYLKKLQ